MLELLLLFVMAVLLGLGCFGAIGWVLFSGEDIGVERIFLVIICLMFGALFLGMSAWMAQRSPLRELWKPAPKEGAGDAAAQQQEAAPEEAPKTASKA